MKKIIDIPVGSSRYDDLVELRYKVLLEPLGLKFLDMHRNKEAGYLHIGCIENLDDTLVGGRPVIRALSCMPCSRSSTFTKKWAIIRKAKSLKIRE